MNSKSGKSQRIRHNYTKAFLLTAALVLIAGVIGGLLFLHFSAITAPAQPSAETNGENTPANTGDNKNNDPGNPGTETKNTPENQTTGENPTEEISDPTTVDVSKYDQFWLTDADSKKIYPLTLINDEHPAAGSSTAKVVNIYNDRAEKHYSLPLNNSGIQLDEQALAALLKLNEKVTEKNPEYQLLIVRGLEGDPAENKCLSADKNDHATGFSVDFRFWKTEKKASVPLTDTALAELAKYLVEEAAKLGFIRTAGSEHFRYVGAVHALYMYENNLTLAQYLEEIAKTNVNSQMEIKDAEGEIFKLFYVKAKSEKTLINVPKSASSFTIWTDNIGGFVVTYDTGEKAPAAQPTEEPET